MPSKRTPLWRQMALEAGAITKEEQLAWKQKAIKAYKARNPKTAEEKYQMHKLGYALKLRHDKPKEPKTTKENLLQQYKDLQNSKNYPTEREVAFDVFLRNIADLPVEIQVELNTTLNQLRQKWGDEAVAKYLDTFGLFEDDMFNDYLVSYQIIMARAYILRLSAALELAAEGAIDADSYEDKASEIAAMIERVAKKPKSKAMLYDELNIDRAMTESITANLAEIFEEDGEDMWI